MSTLTRSILLFGAIAGTLCGCGSNAGLPGLTPSVAIRSPTNNSAVGLPANKQVAINFDTNYNVKAPGQCAQQDHCGHIYVMVDNSGCNDATKTFNNLASSSPTFADFSKCATATGQHTITLELRNDDESVVNTALGSPVTDSVTITTQ